MDYLPNNNTENRNSKVFVFSIIWIVIGLFLLFVIHAIELTESTSQTWMMSFAYLNMLVIFVFSLPFFLASIFAGLIGNIISLEAYKWISNYIVFPNKTLFYIFDMDHGLIPTKFTFIGEILFWILFILVGVYIARRLKNT